jgi:hypothetical protein
VIHLRSDLPLRDWRWSWLSLVLGVLGALVMLVLIVALYCPALVIVALFEFVTSRVERAHVSLINRDIARKHGYTRGADGEWLT